MALINETAAWNHGCKGIRWRSVEEAFARCEAPPGVCWFSVRRNLDQQQKPTFIDDARTLNNIKGNAR